MNFYFQSNSVMNSLKCPRAKSTNHCRTELFSIYQNKHWTIRRRDNHIVVPSSHHIKLKIDWFHIKIFGLIGKGTDETPNVTCNSKIQILFPFTKQCFSHSTAFPFFASQNHGKENCGHFICIQRDYPSFFGRLKHYPISS